MNSDQSWVSIRRAHCQFSDSQIEEEVFKAVELIGGVPEALETASRILIKPNLGYFDTRRHRGRLIALTEPCVTRAILRMIRETNKNEIIIAEGPSPRSISELMQTIGYKKILKEYDVRVVDTNDGPYVNVRVPGGGTILRTYELNKDIAAADATVSIAKLKSHLLMGVSLCMKNLFGLPPIPIYGYWNARWYLHYPVRLPRCLVDLASIFKPCLNIIDGIVGEEEQEWEGPPVESNVILAGNNIVGIDAVGASVMGFDATSEFPEKPFYFDINHVKLAASIGLGPVNLSEIDVRGERLEAVRKDFHVRYLGDLEPSFHLAAREKLTREVEYYRKHLDEMVRIYNGKVVGLKDQRVQWETDSMEEIETKFKPLQLTIKDRFRQQHYSLPFVKKVVRREDDPELYDAYIKS